MDLAFFPSFLEDFLSFFLLGLALFFFDPFALDLAFGEVLEAFFFFLSFALPAVEFDFLATAATFLAAPTTFLARIGPNPGTAVKALKALFVIDAAVPNPCFLRMFAVAGPMPEISVTGVLIIVGVGIKT